MNATTRYWVGGGTAYGNDGSKWSLSSGGTPIWGTIQWQDYDIAVFDVNSGGACTVIINAIGTIGKLQISGGITVTIRPDDVSNRVLDIDTEAGDAFSLAAGSTLIITGLDAEPDINLRLNMNNGTTANINGYLKITESATGYGEFSESSGAIVNFNNGSTYEHNTKESGSDIPESNWNTGSTCLITGIGNSLPGNYDQSFYHLTWDCPSQSNNLDFNGNLETINGNFTLANTNGRTLALSTSAFVNTTIKGNYLQTGGIFAIAKSSADNIMNVEGNFTLSAGSFYMSIYYGAHTTVNLKGNMSLTSGASFYTAIEESAYTNFNFTGSGNQSFTNSGVILYHKTHFAIVSPAILDLGGNVLGHSLYSTGNFTIESGAGLKTSHAGGITSTGTASGCIQLMGTRTYNSGSHYSFYAAGAQSTGTGLPSTISGSVAIGSTSNTTNLSFTKATAINGSLIMMKGSLASSNISYGSTGILEYRGNAGQTMGNNEWPSSIVPNLKINNSYGVAMNGNKTVNTNLNLASGSLSIGASNTLSLNGTITLTSGTISGSTTSNLLLSGSGSTTLPVITGGLNNLNINRSGANITIGGAVTVYGMMTMTAGTCSPGGGSISYGATGTLKYNGTGSTQTTGNGEYPASNGPFNLIIDKPAQTLNLHASRQIDNSIYLDNGILNLGANTLTVAGNFASTVGSIISSSSGQLVFTENILTGQLPASTGISALTINRASGVNTTGNTTVNDNLNLSNGTLSIGSYELTLNGAVTVESGSLTGGASSSIIVGGTGGSTGLPGVELGYLTLNRSNGIGLLGNVTIHKLLTLTNGCLTIGANTLVLNGTISATSNGSLGNSLSTVQVNESTKKEALNFPTAELNNLNVTRLDGTTTTGNVTVHSQLNLNAGQFLIGNYETLTLNGALNESGGNLASTQFSNLTVGGLGDAFKIPLFELYNLTVQRTNGVILGQSLTIYGMLSLILGSVNPGAYTLSYVPNAVLGYSGLSTQTTTDVEWPTASGPDVVFAQNAQSVKLHAGRTIAGSLHLLSGNFEIQSNTLTINGELITSGGILVGGTTSNLEVGSGGMLTPFSLSSLILNNLSLNRSSGLKLTGSLDLHGTMTLTSGDFNIGDQTLILRKPIEGNLQNLKANSTSNLIIDGTSAGLNIGPEENIRISDLNMLTIENTNSEGIMLDGLLDIQNMLTINTGSKFVVQAQGKLSILGDLILIDEESLVLKSDAAATASLILYGEQGPEGSVKIERYLKGYTSSTNGWHLLGSPIGNYLIEGSSFEPGDGDDLFAYSEPENLWLNYDVPGNFTHFENGFGYLVASDGDDTKWFSGVINNQNISFSKLSITDERGWHLLGNPFPSALGWNDGHWPLIGIDHLAKLWKESIHNFIDIDPNDLIPAHNGFFIRANSVLNALTIPIMSRVHGDLNWYKNTDFPSLTLTAQSLENNTATICRIRFHSDATPGFDSRFDSYYLAGFSQPPVFYANTTNAENLSTSTMPAVEETMVDLTFSKGLSGSYSINATGFDSFPVDTKITLRDVQLNLEIDLTAQDSYTFNSTSGDDPDRFQLLFSNYIGIEESGQIPMPMISYSGGKLTITSPSQFEGTTILFELYDLTGRCLIKKQIDPDGEVVINQDIVHGIYIVRLNIKEKAQYISAKIHIF